MAQSRGRQRHRRSQHDEVPRTPAEIAAKLNRDANDPDEVRKALDDAAGMSRNLWLAFLTFGTYLAISVASVTLLLETPIRLPLLNVELPLVAFFKVAPLLFIVFHAYLLLNLQLMVDNVRRYNEMLLTAKIDPEQADDFRLLLTNRCESRASIRLACASRTIGNARDEPHKFDGEQGLRRCKPKTYAIKR